jgi:hypothetical protein
MRQRLAERPAKVTVNAPEGPAVAERRESVCPASVTVTRSPAWKCVPRSTNGAVLVSCRAGLSATGRETAGNSSTAAQHMPKSNRRMASKG